MYDITNEESFNSVQDWVTQIKTYSCDNAQVILVGNKCDMEDERVITTERGKQLADQLGVQFFETSAKENINIKVNPERLLATGRSRTVGWNFLSRMAKFPLTRSVWSSWTGLELQVGHFWLLVDTAKLEKCVTVWKLDTDLEARSRCNAQINNWNLTEIRHS